MAIRSRESKQIEALVAGAILVTLAGVVVPVVTNDSHPRHAPNVESDLEALKGGILRFTTDTRTFPTGAAGATTYHYLFTDGIQPEVNPFASGPSTHVDAFLMMAEMTPTDWKGPYLSQRVGPDPWGNAYIVNVNGFFSSSERVTLISAGPNRRIDTPPSSTQPQSDDLLVVIE